MELVPIRSRTNKPKSKKIRQNDIKKGIQNMLSDVTKLAGEKQKNRFQGIKRDDFFRGVPPTPKTPVSWIKVKKEAEKAEEIKKITEKKIHINREKVKDKIRKAIKVSREIDGISEDFGAEIKNNAFDMLINLVVENVITDVVTKDFIEQENNPKVNLKMLQLKILDHVKAMRELDKNVEGLDEAQYGDVKEKDKDNENSLIVDEKQEPLLDTLIKNKTTKNKRR